MATPYCLICHNIYVQTEEIASTPCGHVYHNDCLSEWLHTSRTCPQCRENCNHTQINRIYIDFACDEDLACAQILKDTKSINVDTDAEETIKILLEHIENGPEKQCEKDEQECEFCKAFQEAYDNAETEKLKISQILDNKEHEHANLLRDNQFTLKRIDQLEMTIRANEHNLRQMQEQLNATEKFTDVIQTDNDTKQETIDNLEACKANYVIELKAIQKQMEELDAKLKEMTIKHEHQVNALCQDFQNENYQKLLKKHFNRSHQTNQPQNDDTNDCRAIVPYCGNIDNWDYIMVPVLNNYILRK